MDFLNWRYTGESAHPAFFGDFSGISTRKRACVHEWSSSWLGAQPEGLLLHFVSKSVETLSFFQIRASSNRARSFFSAAAYASLPSKSRNGGLRSCVNWTIA